MEKQKTFPAPSWANKGYNLSGIKRNFKIPFNRGVDFIIMKLRYYFLYDFFHTPKIIISWKSRKKINIFLERKEKINKNYEFILEIKEL